MALVTSAFVNPVPTSDIVFVGVTWLWAAAASLMYPPKPRVEQPGPYPFRPIAQAPLRIFQDVMQVRVRLKGVHCHMLPCR